MNATNQIQYLVQSEIDKKKWDDCIDHADNGLVYAYSYYLDAMSKHWDALVLNDYEVVMPLTWNKKYGICYLYQPAFTASLGIFGKNIQELLIHKFIQAIPKKFKLTEIALNHKNFYPESIGSLHEKNNFILSLKKEYSILYSSYKENIKRNIKKAEQFGCTIKKNIPVSEVIALSKPIMEQLSNVTSEDYRNFEKLYDFLSGQNKAVTYGIYSPKEMLVASCVYFFSHNRAYYILVGNHPNGKTMGASHYMIDRFVHEHSGENLLLDFEGSDIRNLAYFYSSFGASLEKYPFLKINKLPFWAKWLKP